VDKRGLVEMEGAGAGLQGPSNHSNGDMHRPELLRDFSTQEYLHPTCVCFGGERSFLDNKELSV
jgi:hypothetical protein